MLHGQGEDVAEMGGGERFRCGIHGKENLPSLRWEDPGGRPLAEGREAERPGSRGLRARRGLRLLAAILAAGAAAALALWLKRQGTGLNAFTAWRMSGNCGMSSSGAGGRLAL